MTDRWIEESLNPDLRVSIKAGAVLHEAAGGEHNLAIVKNGALGTVLMLDGSCATASAGAFARQEMLAHVPLMAHAQPCRVLIVGGSDGGVLRETLKHPSVERAALVESDHALTDAVRAHAPEIAGGAFDDERTEIVIADALNYLAGIDKPFDVIIVDGPAEPPQGAALLTHEFFAACRKALAKDGMLAVATGLEATSSDRFKATAAQLMPFFKRMAFAMCAPPSPIGGPVAVILATDDKSFFKLDAGDLAKRQKKRDIASLKYWTPHVHVAAFVLPAFAEGVVEQAIAEAEANDERMKGADKAAREEAKELARTEAAAAKLARKQAREEAEREKAAAKAAKRESKERADAERAAAKAADKAAKDRASELIAAAEKEAKEAAEQKKAAEKAAKREDKEREAAEKAAAKAAKKKDKAKRNGKAAAAAPSAP